MKKDGTLGVLVSVEPSEDPIDAPESLHLYQIYGWDLLW